ncbi:MAG: hypothetical protein AB7T38_13160 [Nitrospirales bacterium]
MHCEKGLPYVAIPEYRTERQRCADLLAIDANRHLQERQKFVERQEAVKISVNDIPLSCFNAGDG